MGNFPIAWQLFNLINPIRHADTPAGVARYKTEPYVIAADVYSLSPHTGRGGWSWYTGSAGWLYRLIVETFLGFTCEVDKLRFSPRLPSDWKSFQLDYRYRETHYQIRLMNSGSNWQGKQRILLDGLEQPDGSLRLRDDRKRHTAEIHFSGQP
jgi:cellobiose phosphorylase